MPSSLSNPGPGLAIIEHFASLKDPRVTGRVSHPLLTVIITALCGVIAGAEGWEDLEEFAEDRVDWLGGFLEMPHGAPSADTFRRVLSALRPASFFECVSSWVKTLSEPLDGQVVAFDGKTIRGALRRDPWGQSLHQVHLWSTKQRLLLAQVGVRGAPEEVDAARKLFELVEMKGAIATGDAAHCSRKTAEAILDAGADYLLHLKANRAALHTAVATYFENAREARFTGTKVRHFRQVTEAHGRYECRQAWSVPAGAIELPGIAWPKLGSITLIERTRATDTKRSTECHYYLSSLSPAVRRIARAAREHWAVENGLHWVLDVQMGEDACAIHDELGAQNFGALRRLAMMMLKRDETSTRGIRAKMKRAARMTEHLERALTRGIA